MTYTYDEDIVSDLHKEAFGFRPSEYFWSKWRGAVRDQRQVIWDDLLVDLDRAIADDKAAKEHAIADFEEAIAVHITSGAKDRATAIRWIVDSLNLSEVDKMYGGEYICYTLGLPYSMEHVFDEVLREAA